MALRVPLSSDEQKNLIIGILNSFLEDIDTLGPYLAHVGFDLAVIKHTRELIPAWMGFYRILHGQYDVERAFADLVSWPPIATRIAELSRQKVGV